MTITNLINTAPKSQPSPDRFQLAIQNYQKQMASNEGLKEELQKKINEVRAEDYFERGGAAVFLKVHDVAI